MTKTELEQAIKNGESVWIALDDKVERLVKLKWFTDSIVMDRDLSHIITKDDFSRLYKTKAEAEHYLHHANITRTEQLPFLTWEEFLKKKNFYFYDLGRVLSKLFIDNNKIILSQAPDSGEWDVLKPTKLWDLTEANFYKAYDESVKLFKGE